jgi:hypothetical protein
VVSLPAGLSFARNARATAARLGLKVLGKRKLQLRTSLSKGVAGMSAVITNGALRVSPALRKRVKNHPKLTIVLRVTDVSGKAFTLRKRVTAR